MTAPVVEPSMVPTLAEVVERLGGIPLERIPAVPAPGTATEADVLARPRGEKRLYELVDGVLVEKPMGYYESRLAAILIWFLEGFLGEHDLGIVVGESGTIRLAAGLVRIPDVAFFAWRHFPNRELPGDPIPDLAPDLAVEVLSEGNTPAEMERKLGEYFAAGVRLVWYLDPRNRTARVYTSPDSVSLVTEAGSLDGGEVLPGFILPLRDWFARAGKQARRASE